MSDRWGNRPPPQSSPPPRPPPPRASDEWKVGPDPAAELRETRDRLRSTAALLRDFYLAYRKPEWQEGETETEAASRAISHLAELEQEGIEEARLPDIEGDG